MLRQWRDSDLEPFAAMNADAEVMRHFPAPLSREVSTATFARIRADIDRLGWGVWAVECDGVFAGMVGLHVPRNDLPFSPCTEVLWRFRKEFWGKGVALAAAKQAIDYGFTKLDLAEIVAFTVPANVHSIGLMERLGFTHDPQGEFNHPALPPGHALSRHVLYRLRK